MPLGRMLLGIVHVPHEYLIGHLQDPVLDIQGCEDIRAGAVDAPWPQKMEKLY